MPWVGLRCVIVVFPDHTHFLCETLIEKELILIESGEVHQCINFHNLTWLKNVLEYFHNTFRMETSSRMCLICSITMFYNSCRTRVLEQTYLPV